jgi:hypothetical protein
MFLYATRLQLLTPFGNPKKGGKVMIKFFFSLSIAFLFCNTGKAFGC